MSQPEPVDNPLTIWIVNPLDDIPGEHFPAQRTWSLARLMASRGHDVTWWSANWSHRKKTSRTAPLGVRNDEGFSVRLVAVRGYEQDMARARFMSHRDFGRTFERLANESVAAGHLTRPDIILATLPPIDGPEAAARLAARLNSTLVIDALNSWPESLEGLVPGPTLFRPFIKRFLLGRMTNRRNNVLRAADAIAAASPECIPSSPMVVPDDVPRFIAPLGGYPQQFDRPPRSIDHVALAPGIQLVQRTAEQNTDTLECVHAGQLSAAEDIDTLLAAVRHLSQHRVHATIHFTGQGKFEQNVRNAAAATNGSCRLVVHGLLDQKTYADLLARCDVGLVLTRPESVSAMPSETFDYASAGLAMVGGLKDLMQPILDEPRAGLHYTSGEPDSLSQAIRTLAEDRSALAMCRQRARMLAEQAFNREKITSLYADWLEGLRTL